MMESINKKHDISSNGSQFEEVNACK